MEDIEPLPVTQPQTLPAAILSAHPLSNAVMPQDQRHVRNFEYLVRWHGRSHASNSVVPYDAVWSSTAFDEFVKGSGLTGHIPPQQFQAAHMAQAGAMLRGNLNPGPLPMADPQGQARALSHYFPMAAPPRPNPTAIVRLAERQPLALSQDNGPPEFSPQPLSSQTQQSRDTEELSASTEQSGPRMLRRSLRDRKTASFGEEFTT
jgi:hypothetical protein